MPVSSIWDSAGSARRRRRRLRSGRTLRVATALLLLSGILMLVRDQAAAAVVRDFGVRFQSSDTGDIVLVGNTTMTCPAGQPACSPGATAADSAVDPAAPTPTYLDVDDDPSTFSSSRAALELPAGAEVLWAGLYWGGTGDGDPGAQVRLARPSLGYEAVGAIQLDIDNDGYQGFADVTAGVRASGAGVYTVADVYAEPASPGSFGGWALVVVVRDPTAPLRSLTVFDGFAALGPSGLGSLSTTVKGFNAPASGAVGARVGVVAYGGAAGVSGDGLALNDQALADGANPPGDVFNGSISRAGAAVGDGGGRTDSLGVDVDDLAAPPGSVANGATTATLAVQSSGDALLAGVLTSVIDTVQPHLVVSKSGSESSGGPAEVGDAVGYTIEVVNRGNERADSVVLTDPMPEGASFVPGSLHIDNGLGPAVGTEAADSDPVQYDAGVDGIVVGLGAAATVAGGSLEPGGVVTVQFRVQVDAPVPGDRLANQAQVSYQAASTGTARVTLSDDPARSGVGDTTETPANTAPEPAADEAVSDGQPVAIDVLANDVDPEGEALSIVAVEAADAGSVSCPPSGPCTYQPPAGFAGTATFAYQVGDAGGLRSATTVTVGVTPAPAPAPPPAPPAPPPAPPVPEAPPTTQVPEASTTTAPPPTTTVPTTTTTTAAPAPSTTASTTTTAAPAPPPAGSSAGEARSTSAGTALAFADTPGTAGTGPSAGASAAATAANPSAAAPAPVSVGGAAAGRAAAQAQGPRVVDDAVTTEAGRSVVIRVLDNDGDPDGDLAPGSLSLVQTPSRGSATAGEGTVRYSPGAGYAGGDELSYRICDAGGRCGEAMVRVMVTQLALPAVPAQGAPTTSTTRGSTTPTSSATTVPGTIADGRLAGTGLDTRTPLALGLLLLALGTGMVSEAHRIVPLARRGRRRPQHRRSRWR